MYWQLFQADKIAINNNVPAFTNLKQYLALMFSGKEPECLWELTMLLLGTRFKLTEDYTYMPEMVKCPPLRLQGKRSKKCFTKEYSQQVTTKLKVLCYLKSFSFFLLSKRNFVMWLLVVGLEFQPPLLLSISC